VLDRLGAAPLADGDRITVGATQIEYRSA